MCIEHGTGHSDMSVTLPAEALLPWYINGSLTVPERLELEGWLRASADARRQLQVWQCVAQTALAVTREQAASSTDEVGAWLSIQRAQIAAGLSEEGPTAMRADQHKSRFRPGERALIFGCLGAVALVLVLLFVNVQGVFS